jgi:hypothetical protein
MSIYVILKSIKSDDIHATVVIRTRKTSKEMAADAHLRPRDNRNIIANYPHADFLQNKGRLLKFIEEKINVSGFQSTHNYQ